MKNEINNKSKVINPKIIVVPMLKNVDETIVGIIIKIENGLKIPPVKYKRNLIETDHIKEIMRHKYL